MRKAIKCTLAFLLGVSVLILLGGILTVLERNGLTIYVLGGFLICWFGYIGTEIAGCWDD